MNALLPIFLILFFTAIALLFAPNIIVALLKFSRCFLYFLIPLFPLAFGFLSFMVMPKLGHPFIGLIILFFSVSAQKSWTASPRRQELCIKLEEMYELFLPPIEPPTDE